MTAWVADVLAALGPLGVGLLTLLETVFPPIPSEVVLPLAGYLAGVGRMSWWLAFAAATAGSLLGALALYGAGAAVGTDRAAALLGRLPLVDADDVTRASGWFDRHGTASVLLGRLVPGVRSLVSLPAGAARMPLLPFTLATTVGSAAWNAALLGAGAALGSRWHVIEEHSGYVDAAALAAVAGAIGVALWRRRDRIRLRHGHASRR